MSVGGFKFFMSKRFEYVYLEELGVNAVKDNYTKKHIPLTVKVVDELNILHNFNMKLKWLLENYHTSHIIDTFDEKHVKRNNNISEKRFQFRDTVDLKKRICDDYTNKTYDGTLKDQKDLCDLLNTLSEENHQIKEYVYELNNKIKELEIKKRV